MRRPSCPGLPVRQSHGPLLRVFRWRQQQLVWHCWRHQRRLQRVVRGARWRARPPALCTLWSWECSSWRPSTLASSAGSGARLALSVWSLPTCARHCRRKILRRNHPAQRRPSKHRSRNSPVSAPSWSTASSRIGITRSALFCWPAGSSLRSMASSTPGSVRRSYSQGRTSSQVQPSVWAGSLPAPACPSWRRVTRLLATCTLA
mmetsp:Transcript_25244/g.57266  ORF Transcript_25244/g.57266 Transcript_25244/m.57266 type:complete len:204 (-) Transcript_25244:271-882(-)